MLLWAGCNQTSPRVPVTRGAAERRGCRADDVGTDGSAGCKSGVGRPLVGVGASSCTEQHAEKEDPLDLLGRVHPSSSHVGDRTPRASNAIAASRRACVLQQYVSPGLAQ